MTLWVQVWDINEPGPASLGGPFNLVTASNAIHTCGDIAKTLGHVYDLLADDGFLLFYEYTVSPLAWSHMCLQLLCL